MNQLQFTLQRSTMPADFLVFWRARSMPELHDHVDRGTSRMPEIGSYIGRFQYAQS